MGPGIGKQAAAGRQAGAVARNRAAAASLVGVEGLIRILKAQRLKGEPQLPHAIAHHRLVGGSPHNADRPARQIWKRSHPSTGWNHHPTGVVIDDRGKAERVTSGSVPGERHGGVARQQIYLAAGEGRKAFVATQRAQLQFCPIPQHRRRHGFADVNIKAGVNPIGLQRTEAGQLAIDAADESAAGADLGHASTDNSTGVAVLVLGARCQQGRQQAQQQGWCQDWGQPPGGNWHHWFPRRS